MTDDLAQSLDRVSAFFAAHEPAIEALPPGSRGLDLACGRGRNSLAAADLGLEMLCVDRNVDALRDLASQAPVRRGRIETRVLDLETPEPPVLDGGPFDVILVFRYLHRPLMPWIGAQLAPGGFLLYETFTVAQRALRWGPSSDAFLLEEGELRTLFPGLEIEEFSEGLTEEPRPAHTARLRARRNA